jgi:hypothetical protein
LIKRYTSKIKVDKGIADEQALTNPGYIYNSHAGQKSRVHVGTSEYVLRKNNLSLLTKIVQLREVLQSGLSWFRFFGNEKYGSRAVRSDLASCSYKSSSFLSSILPGLPCWSSRRFLRCLLVSQMLCRKMGD